MSTRVTGRLVGVWRNPRNRSFALAIVVGSALRLAWAIWATGSPQDDLSDPAQYLSAAVRFSGLETPSLYGNPTAFFPPGYALMLAPVTFISRHTGWFSIHFGASLANVVLATATIALTAQLAKEWIGASARNPAAWIMALAAGHIYFTSAALSETLFATLTMAVLLAASVLFRPQESPRTRTIVLLGLLIGWAMLVRAPGAILILAPALVLRATTGSWGGAARVTGWALVGSLVLIVPWTIRNVVEVGVLAPISTNNAAFMCTGHRDGATGGFDPTPDGLRYCFGGSAYDPENADEANWYGSTTARAVKWALTHPVEEVRLTLWKTYDTMADDREALGAAEDFGNQRLASPRFREVLVHLADSWHWAVLAFSAAALWWVPACRRAAPLWVTAAAYLVAVWGGLALSRYHHAIMPILVVFAAAAIAAIRSAREPLSDTVSTP